MPAYVVAMMSIHDPEHYKNYTDRTPPLVKKYGGKFLTRGEDITCVEGADYDGRMVLLEFHQNNMSMIGIMILNIRKPCNIAKPLPR